MGDDSFVGGLIGTIFWMGAMYFLFFSGDDGDVTNGEEKGLFDFLSQEDEPVVDDYSYGSCVEELTSKQYDNDTIEQLCSLREVNSR